MTRLLFILLLLAAPLWAQDDLLLHYPAPDDWKKEVIALPPDFAPELDWKGQECLRFSPGMFKADAPDFFSYTFSLVLDESVSDLEDDLIEYYSGLTRAVLKNDKFDTSWFRLRRTSPRRYELYWLEPFATKKPQYLQLFIEQFDEEGKIWFVCASPKGFQDPVWEKLQLYRRLAKAIFRELHR
jgi:hypothetical protein